MAAKNPRWPQKIHKIVHDSKTRRKGTIFYLKSIISHLIYIRIHTLLVLIKDYTENELRNGCQNSTWPSSMG